VHRKKKNPNKELSSKFLCKGWWAFLKKCIMPTVAGISVSKTCTQVLMFGKALNAPRSLCSVKPSTLWALPELGPYAAVPHMGPYSRIKATYEPTPRAAIGARTQNSKNPNLPTPLHHHFWRKKERGCETLKALNPLLHHHFWRKKRERGEGEIFESSGSSRSISSPIFQEESESSKRRST
jgi:hypothetical protein